MATSNTFPLNEVEYLAEDLRRWFAGRTPGVLNVTGNDFMITPAGGLGVSVSEGQAYLCAGDAKNGGVMYWLEDALSLSEGAIYWSTQRYDYVSIRYYPLENRTDFEYRIGTESIPNPIRTESCFELILAYIKIPANTAEVRASNIVDTRMDSRFCGLCVDTLTRIPTDSYNRQLTEFIDENQSNFTSWFDNIKGQLSEDAAGNLQNQIDELIENVRMINKTIENIVLYDKIEEELTDETNDGE